MAELSLRSAETLSMPEYQVKAAFLYNFAKFVEWPKDAFRDTNSPIVIGVFGKDPFGLDLEKVVGQRKVNGRNVVIKRFNNVMDARSTQIVFVPASEQEHWIAMSKAIQGQSVLTVGETTQFVEAGGVAALVLEGKIRITLNMEAARRARLAISSHLQNYARIIRPGPSQPK
ncbi:MAG: YfiR family protein [Verrucomicrobia bacterium]|nr:YfiR family protein [Verrucomicrobiota bacterium]